MQPQSLTPQCIIHQWNQLPLNNDTFDNAFYGALDYFRERNITNIAVKAYDGIDYMGEFYRHQLLPDVQTLRWLQDAFLNEGVTVGYWVNVRGFAFEEQAVLHAEIAMLSRWLALDLEPYPRFLGWPVPVDRLVDYIDALIYRTSEDIGDDWDLVAWPDPRAHSLRSLGWEQYYWRFSYVAGQVYWPDFEQNVWSALSAADRALVHPDRRVIVPRSAEPREITLAYDHPLMGNGANALWLLPASADVLAAFLGGPEST